MKKTLIAIGMLLLTATAANAGGIVSKHASSVQLTVDAARTQATRIGSTFSITGSNIDTSITSGQTTSTDAISMGTITSGIYAPGTVKAEQKVAGSAFDFTQSYTEGDAIPSSEADVGEVPNFGSILSYAPGSAGDLAGTINSASVIDVTAGGAGTTATGQFTAELTVIY